MLLPKASYVGFIERAFGHSAVRFGSFPSSCSAGSRHKGIGGPRASRNRLRVSLYILTQVR